MLITILVMEYWLGSFEVYSIKNKKTVLCIIGILGSVQRVILMFPRVEWPTTWINLIKCQILMFLSMIHNSFDDGKKSILNFLIFSQTSSKNRLFLADIGRWLSVNCWWCWSFVLFRWKKNVNLSFKMDGRSFSKRICCDIPHFS